MPNSMGQTRSYTLQFLKSLDGPNSSALSEICALPTDWIPNVKPSKVIQKLDEQKQRLHDQRIVALKHEMTVIKLKTEEQIRGASLHARFNILNEKTAMEKDFAHYTFDFGKSVPKHVNAKGMYRKLRDCVQARCFRIKCEIECNTFNLRKFEAERMERLKDAMRKARLELEELSYKLPHELHSYFEMETMRLNQVTLGNYHTYNDLHAQLLSMALSCENSWLKRVAELHDEFRRQYELMLQKNEILGMSNVERAEMYAEDITSQLFKVGCDLQATLDTLMKITKVLHDGRYDELHQVEPVSVGFPKRTFAEIYNEIFSSLFQATDGPPDEFEQIQQLWLDVVQVLIAAVALCRQITAQGQHIFDKHFARQVEVTEIFAEDLAQMVDQSEDVENASLVELHLVIDTLRMSPDKESIQSGMGECKSLIDTIYQTAQKSYQSNVKHFDKLREYMLQEADILILEMIYYVKSFPSDEDVNPTIFRDRASSASESTSEDKPLIMRMIEADVLAMHNWLYGLQQSLKNASNQCRASALEYANNWINRQHTILYTNLTIRTAMLEDLFQRIFHHIYRVRMAEILTHQMRFEEHLNGINKAVKHSTTVGSGTPKSTNFCVSNILEFNKHVEKLKSASETSKGNPKDILRQLEGYKKKSEEEMRSKRSKLEETKFNKYNNLLCLNMAYVKSLRFFGEGGNYTAVEISEKKQALATVNKEIRACKNTIRVDLDEQLRDALEELDKGKKELTEIVLATSVKYEFREFLKNHLAQLRMALKDETNGLVEQSNVLSAYVQRLQSLAEQNIGDVDYLDDFLANCEYMQGIFRELYSHLLQQDAFNLSESFFKHPLSNSLEVTHTTLLANLEAKMGLDEDDDPSPKQTKTEPTSDRLFQIVFPAVPNGDNYMAKIVRLLLESLQNLQTRVETFYKDSSANTMSSEEVYASKESFMIGHLATHLFYQLQCDEILLEVTINYILELDELLSFMTNYHKRSIEKFGNNKIEKFARDCACYKAEIHKHRGKVETDYKQINDQLRPLYGHPMNTPILNKLGEQIYELRDEVEQQQTKMDDLYVKYKDRVARDLTTFDKQVNKMETRLKACVDDFITMYIQDEQLFDQLRMKLDYFDRIILGGENIIQTEDANMNIDIVERINSKLKLLKVGLRVSSPTFSEGIKMKISSTNVIKEKYSSTRFSSVANIDFQLMRKKFEEDQERCLDEISSSKGIIDMYEQWLIIWKDNIKKINGLYEVKYVPLLPEPKKSKPVKK